MTSTMTKTMTNSRTDIRTIYSGSTPLVTVDLTGLHYLDAWILDWYAAKYEMARDPLRLGPRCQLIERPTAQEIRKYQYKGNRGQGRFEPYE